VSTAQPAGELRPERAGTRRRTCTAWSAAGSFPTPEAAAEALHAGALRPHLSAPVDAVSFTEDAYVVIAHLPVAESEENGDP